MAWIQILKAWILRKSQMLWSLKEFLVRALYLKAQLHLTKKVIMEAIIIIIMPFLDKLTLAALQMDRVLIKGRCLAHTYWNHQWCPLGQGSIIIITTMIPTPNFLETAMEPTSLSQLCRVSLIIIMGTGSFLQCALGWEITFRWVHSVLLKTIWTPMTKIRSCSNLRA